MKEEKDIIEGNKLICSFMEYKQYNGHNDYFNHGDYAIPEKSYYVYSRQAEENVKTDSYSLKSLQFHSSYDWLMPVLQKIEKYAIIEINYALVVTCRICYLGKNKYDKAINFYGDNNGEREPIEAIWDCVVEFLKFYNEKEKNTGQNTKPDNEN